MDDLKVEIREIGDKDRLRISKFISDNWGSILSISKGKIQDTSRLPGFVCKVQDNIAGAVTYNIEREECEIVTLDCKIGNKGFGTKLINKVIVKARETKCKRIWLVTTNDNANAIRFYQKRGFEWVGFYKDAMQKSRLLKPEIPEFGFDNIPIKHEIEFEYKLNQQ
jgi:N-acetylglutamate synthase-like GNAT family acetyltransferase